MAGILLGRTDRRLNSTPSTSTSRRSRRGERVPRAVQTSSSCPHKFPPPRTKSGSIVRPTPTAIEKPSGSDSENSEKMFYDCQARWVITAKKEPALPLFGVQKADADATVAVAMNKTQFPRSPRSY